MGSGRRHTAKNKSTGLDSGKKVPNTARNDSSKSTPSNALIAAKTQSQSGKNMQSTGNMMTLTHGIFSERYLTPASHSGNNSQTNALIAQ